jgi:hypothetical protein
MRLPNSDKSFVSDSKVLDYLLNLDHEKGKSKAKFFLARGFGTNDIESFKTALRNHAIVREIYKETDSIYGKKYELRCEIDTPDLRNPCIVTVWIIDDGTDEPKLVTAYPNK